MNIIVHWTKCYLYSTDRGFKFQLRDKEWPFYFVVLLSVSRQISEWNLKLRNDSFIPYFFNYVSDIRVHNNSDKYEWSKTAVEFGSKSFECSIMKLQTPLRWKAIPFPDINSERKENKGRNREHISNKRNSIWYSINHIYTIRINTPSHFVQYWSYTKYLGDSGSNSDRIVTTVFYIQRKITLTKLNNIYHQTKYKRFVLIGPHNAHRATMLVIHGIKKDTKF